MRYERKFPSHHLSAATLEQLIVYHPLGFRKIFPNRQINNVYFDTPGRHTFYENLAGISCRTKFRLRWYGTPLDHIQNAQFELKKKENLLGDKINYPIEGKIIWANIPFLTDQLPSLRANSLLPTLVNSYVRTYYQSADERFRLTLDQNLQCAPYLSYDLSLRSFPAQLQIVELKYGVEEDPRLDDFTQYWPLRTYRFSKYVSGMQLIYT